MAEYCSPKNNQLRPSCERLAFVQESTEQATPVPGPIAIIGVGVGRWPEIGGVGDEDTDVLGVVGVVGEERVEHTPHVVRAEMVVTHRRHRQLHLVGLLLGLDEIEYWRGVSDLEHIDPFFGRCFDGDTRRGRLTGWRPHAQVSFCLFPGAASACRSPDPLRVGGEPDEIT